MFENNSLYSKLENLENIFIGSSINREGLQSASSKMSEDYMTSTLMLENTELKKRVAFLEAEKLELKQHINNIEGHGGQMATGPMGGGV